VLPILNVVLRAARKSAMIADWNVGGRVAKSLPFIQTGKYSGNRKNDFTFVEFHIFDR
jgi:hypothetical protein